MSLKSLEGKAEQFERELREAHAEVEHLKPNFEKKMTNLNNSFQLETKVNQQEAENVMMFRLICCINKNRA